MFESVRVRTSGKDNVLVLGRFKGARLDKATKELDADGAGAGAAARAECDGSLGCIAEAFNEAGQRVIVVGLGEKKTLSAGTFRAVAGALGRRLAAIKADKVGVELDGPIVGAKLDEAEVGCAFGEGLGLLAWTCDEFRGSATTPRARAKLSVRSSSKAFRDGMERGLGLAESANIARTLSQTPPNIATPAYMAQQAKKIARQTGMKCTVIKGAELEKEKMAGHINVGKASENEPCIIRLEYTPARAGRGSKPAVLIGKTITYDTGGLSLKISNGMKGMKRDKDGGCAVLGAMHAIATVIKPRKKVVGLLVAAENSVSDEAYRPDDVLEFRNGVTVEVTNTDAEGRLVLADGLCWACAKENPAFILDMATLTGGVVVALGKVYAGLWCDDDKLRASVEEAAEVSGERVWRLPHHADYNEMMRSPVADIVNSAPVREAHPIQGAAFLSYFVDEGVAWAHIDIAGTHAVDKDTGPFIAGPTGFGTRLVAELMERV
jgi:leucyl aminopeptidase